MLTEQTKTKLNKLVTQYPDNRSAVLPVLHAVQNEKGCIDMETMQEIAEVLDIEPIEVLDTASYYSMFYREPVGKYVIQVCTNISCALLGADNLANYLEQKLGIKVNETTPDNKFTLITVECLGACDKAPVMMVNDDFYTHLTPEKIDSILSTLS
ncbi:MAG: NADH-quinone oxidoreductase subunit NuoE [bacterium]|nr:NADH-quinone oxidoreductase subunit NuoE [bacterium]